MVMKKISPTVNKNHNCPL